MRDVSKPKLNGRRILYFVLLMCAWHGGARAERLPVRSYTTADGLANNVINCIRRDSRGFLWLCTREGLSRFDGYGFTNYGREHGLPSATVNDFIETRAGEYWVATAAGLCRFNPRGRAQASTNEAEGERMFTVFSPGTDARAAFVNTVYETSAGVVWLGTRAGLFRVERAAVGETRIEFVDLGIPDHLENRYINSLLEDRRGVLWVGAASGLFRRLPDGRIEAFTAREGLPDVHISSLLEDREGRVWVGTRFGGLFRLIANPRPNEPAVARAYTMRDGLSATWINQIFQTSDGDLWAGSPRGLIQFVPAGDDFRFRTYGESHGLNYDEVQSLAEDRNGNLWLGLASGGAAKLARAGFITYGAADNLAWASGLFERRDGEIIVVGGFGSSRNSISRFDGERFVPFRPRFPQSNDSFTCSWNQTVIEDSRGDW